MSSPDPKQLQVAHAVLDHLNVLDYTALAEFLAPDFKHRYLPSTIHAADGKVERGKDEWLEVVKYNSSQLFEKVTYGPPLDVIHGASSVVFHLTSVGMSKSGKQYKNEYMVTFHFEGDKIVKLNEFVDSSYSIAYFAALRAEL
ncbi:hypothetical protein FB45DRAFT_1032228 [Roridomyces roridus]|uniref:SnoaL-like domain-containing protein n=1 Tax=Roridomyces roridus TaxID=1738132 RepID=A0AAD7FFA9_9AGAR|nr:hypothetical protein FB45DRAFT_1032228 [Roridomyces roridus]